MPHLGDERATTKQRLVNPLEVDEVFVDDSLEKEDLLIMPEEGNAPLVRMLLHFSLGDEWLNLAGSRIELPSYRAKLLVEAFSFFLRASGEPEGKYVCLEDQIESGKDVIQPLHHGGMIDSPNDKSLAPYRVSVDLIISLHYATNAVDCCVECFKSLEIRLD